MRQNKKKYKILLAVLAVLLLAVVLAGSVFAVSANVQEVLDRLGSLQRSSIDPGWLPDIQHNESAVQALLDSYLRCSSAEKDEFTQRQNADLRDYFEALYEVQGKDPADVDDIFAGRVSAPASSSTSVSFSAVSSSSSASVTDASSTSAVSASSSARVSSSSGSQSIAGSSSGSSSAYAGAVVTSSSSASKAEVAAVFFPPQTPEAGGWIPLFGNRAMGGVWIVILMACTVLLFLHFMVAMRAAGEIPNEAWAEDFRSRELFGEDYGGTAGSTDTEQVPVAVSQKAVSTKAKKKRRRAVKKEKEEMLKSQPETTPESIETGLDDVLPKAAVSAKQDELQTKIAKQAAYLENPFLEREKRTSVSLQSFGGPQPQEKEPDIKMSNDMDAAPVKARVAPRRKVTGKPPKMPFRQGAPDDIDAIDE